MEVPPSAQLRVLLAARGGWRALDIDTSEDHIAVGLAVDGLLAYLHHSTLTLVFTQLPLYEQHRVNPTDYEH